MAFRWMEAARYADTNGYQTDGTTRDVALARLGASTPSIATCRSIEFTVDQLAGDLLPNATLDQTHRHRLSIATIAPMREGGIMPEEYRVEYVADRARDHCHSVARPHAGLRPLPRSQIRSVSRKKISTACSPTSTTFPKRAWSTTTAMRSRTSKRRRPNSKNSLAALDQTNR